MIANNIFLDNFASATGSMQHYQVIFRDYYTAIHMEDYFTFTKNMVTGPMHFQKPSGGVDYADVAAFDAAGYGYDNLVHTPTFVDPANDDYRLLPPSIFDQGPRFCRHPGSGRLRQPATHRPRRRPASGAEDERDRPLGMVPG